MVGPIQPICIVTSLHHGLIITPILHLAEMLDNHGKCDLMQCCDGEVNCGTLFGLMHSHGTHKNNGARLVCLIFGSTQVKIYSN